MELIKLKPNLRKSFYFSIVKNWKIIKDRAVNSYFAYNLFALCNFDL